MPRDNSQIRPQNGRKVSNKPAAPYCRPVAVLTECEKSHFGRQTVTGSVRRKEDYKELLKGRKEEEIKTKSHRRTLQRQQPQPLNPAPTRSEGLE